MTIIDVDRLVRATTKPYPGAFIIEASKKITIWSGIASKAKVSHDNYHEIKLKDGFIMLKIMTLILSKNLSST